MKESSYGKKIVLTIILAIIASALWENVFRGFFNFIFRVLLTISTLGIEKYKDNIYVDISKGFYEKASLTIIALLLGAFLGVIYATLSPVFRRKEEESGNNDKSRIKNWISSHRRTYKSVLLVYLAFVTIFTILNISELAYINKSIAYYNQLVNISRPYISLNQEYIFNSRFAQIQNSNDYKQLVQEISDIVLKSNQKLPESPSFIF
jgi:hypothetical protein